MQNVIKLVLAYSTIENIGLICVALVFAIAFQGNGMKAAAALAMTAALFHVLNHSLFKSLLFFGAGAVLAATGERSMEKLGGLLNRMPATGLLFLVGSVAIRSEEHTSELQSLMRISYAVFCLKTKTSKT